MELSDTSEEGSRSVIRISGLSVWTPEEKSWWRRKVTKPSTLILNNISGCIKEGEFTAILGPSGAGKTTFLVSLAGKCQMPTRGVVTLGGRDVRLTQGAVEIVPQHDVFMPGLTVDEHLVFMTELKVGNCKTDRVKRMLRDLMKEMNLKNIARTNISKLSGGEKRLLSLTTSLLSSPQILMCDEPTTGLDSYNALLVVDTLKKLTLCGKAVICTVHQPSMDLLKQFSSIMLMADGKLLFHGSHDECKDMFESLNLYCPKNYNPAEFYIREVSRLSPELTGKMEATYQPLCDTPNEFPARKPVYRRNWFKQVQLLLWRSSLTFSRDLKGQLFQLFVNVVVTSLVIGTCYVGISGTSQRGVQDLRGLLWLMTSEVCFALAYSALFAFEEDLSLFKREVGTYSCSSYYVARLLGYVPRCVAWPLMLVLLMTLAVQLPQHALTATKFFVTLSFAAVAASAYGLGMGTLFTSTGAMGDVMPCADLPLFLMSGAFLRVSSLPFWLQPLRFLSHFYYAMDAVSNIYWRQIGNIDCPTNSTSVCFNDGASVLVEAGYSTNFILQDSLGMLGVTVFWSILAYYGLKREEKKGYAY
ncbi:hypothetical protein evm_004686 [Chilo suppressalis]|nr:hypothetical protein evm_004686 [Chilo suppressalis]